MPLPSNCKSDVDSVAVVRRQSQGKPNELAMVREYKTLLLQFKDLCTRCNDTDSLGYDTSWINRIRRFVGHLNTFVIPLMLVDDQFTTSVRKLMCWKQRCRNLQGWPQTLSKDFLNWLCHKTAYMGYSLLGIEQRDRGAPGSSEMKSKVQTLVTKACQVAPKRGLKTRVEKANHAFFVSHSVRQLRYGPQLPLCEEAENSAHTYQRCLMQALYEATQEWLRNHH
jgi:hypothetical protein